LDFCADCGEEFHRSHHAPRDEAPHAEREVYDLAFSAAGGGAVCANCQPKQREKRPMLDATRRALEQLQATGEAWRTVQDPHLRSEVRQLLNHYVTYLLGRRP